MPQLMCYSFFLGSISIMKLIMQQPQITQSLIHMHLISYPNSQMGTTSLLVKLCIKIAKQLYCSITIQQQFNRSMQSMPQQCSKCSLVKSIVKANQLMIHQQIKFIKTLQAEKEQLQAKYNLLELQCKSLEAINQQLSTTRITLEAEQQTEPFILTSKGNSNQIVTPSLRAGQKEVKEKKIRKSSLPQINKENIEQFLPIVMIRKDQQYFSRKRKNSYEEEHLTKEWIKTMDLMGSTTTHKFKEKTFTFVKKGIPHQLRHIVWPIAIDNHLALSDELYFELLERRKDKWVPQEVKSQISRDICRSFTGRTQYESTVGLREDVTEVLELFHLYRPDVSYVQGMTYPVIVLTITVGKVKAFTIFSNMVLVNPFFKRLFTFEPNFILILARTFDHLLLESYQQVALNLKQKQIDSQTYLVEWFFTVFSRSLSFEGTLKFWDHLLYTGEIAFFRLSLAIMDLVGPRILSTSYEETIGLIQGFAGFGKEKKLIDSLGNHKITTQKLHKTIERMESLFQKGEIQS